MKQAVKTPHFPVSFPCAQALKIHANWCSHKFLSFVQQRPLLGCSGAPHPQNFSHFGEPNLAIKGCTWALCSEPAHIIFLTGERLACCGVAPEPCLWGRKIQVGSSAGNFETHPNIHFQVQGHKPYWCKFHINEERIIGIFCSVFGSMSLQI